MPFIEKQDRTERVPLNVKIRPDVIAELEKYSKFSGNDAWHDVQELLRKAMKLDKDFQASVAPEAITPRKKRTAA